MSGIARASAWSGLRFGHPELAWFSCQVHDLHSGPDVVSGSRCSEARTALLIGSRYVPALLSGKIDIRHDVAPTTAATRTEPKPRRIPALISLMSALTWGGSDTKYHPSSPG